eukprot:598650-Pyramimonas_sp.AAC.1
MGLIARLANVTAKKSARSFCWSMCVTVEHLSIRIVRAYVLVTGPHGCCVRDRQTVVSVEHSLSSVRTGDACIRMVGACVLESLLSSYPST